MTRPSIDPPPRNRIDRKEVERAERFELLEHIQAALEPIMVGLGFVFLGLLLVDYADLVRSAGARMWLDRAFVAIWMIFLVDFSIRFVVAPEKLKFLRTNWLGALSLALPFLRPLRALRAARALRSISLVRLLGGVNRGVRVLRRVTRGRQFAYIGALTLLVVLAGAVGALYFDRDAQGTTIVTFGDALWWSSALVTTMSSEKYAVSAEARVIAILMRLFALSIFGYITASIATYLIGKDVADRAASESTADMSRRPDDTLLRDQIATLHAEVIALREEVASLTEGPSSRAADDSPR